MRYGGLGQRRTSGVGQTPRRHRRSNLMELVCPVLKRFQWPLIQVLLASLFIQLFQLANPLLLQQIIDKVINQSNLSALQVLGAAWSWLRCSRAADSGAHLVVDRHDRPHGLIAGKPSDRQAVAATASLFRKETCG